MLTLIATLLIAGHDAPRRPPVDPYQSAVAISIFRQTAPHWILSCDTAEIRRQQVQFDITLDSRGRIVAGPTPVRPRNDPYWRAAADNARRALIDAAPFEAPAGFPGGSYRPTFLAERACAAADEP